MKVMRKIIPEAITTLDARMLCRALIDASPARLLAYVSPINSGVLGLVCNSKVLPFVTPRLLAEVANGEEERIRQPTSDLLIDAMYHMMSWRIRWDAPFFPSIDSVREFHNRVLEETLRRSEAAKRRARTKTKQGRKLKPGEFPLPPVPGTNDIIPLTTKVALRAEGFGQKNCAGSYGRRVRSGSIYIYKVLFPDRATLAIKMGPDGFWWRAELESAANRPVSWLTKAKVDQWLNTHSLSV